MQPIRRAARLAILVIAVCALGASPRQSPPPAADVTGWFCPMHPEVTSAEAGRCRKCGMALVAGDPFDTREFIVEISTAPKAVKAGVPIAMSLAVRNPGTGDLVRNFETVHEKRFHLFVVSRDMEFFQHVHPEQRPDGNWVIEMTLPKAGYYQLLSDFLPSGASPQFVGHTLITADFDGDLESQSAHLQPDTVTSKTVGSITAFVQYEPSILVAGQFGHLSFTLTDATTRQPVTDLQPYLGAFGHMLMLSEDMLDYVHSHPFEGPESDTTKGFGGPNVTFEGYLPRPGRYRAWSQFMRRGEVITVPFTLDVATLEEAVRGNR